ncbi:histone deacetylase [Litorilinea aerophila]|uniref:Histone deacetylase n=1 Tax=Litorilinea aerophila TaxID=1204385 RepID=A0A540VDK6_9CHLR|nr:histone deacetylase [Litorilinea aerophila]MCC9077476.1 histone deacetylase [Litorilinea aerophila]OUC06293.1 histone deacetylase [Litorilinea aerophila]GIV77553.1 MAG: histone deacetylase [Litorilinea sp.]
MSLPLVYHPDYVTPLPPGHRFPMPKFGKVYETLIRDGTASLDQFHCPQPAPRAWLELAHAPEYVEAFCQGTLDARAIRRIGLPWSPGLVHRSRTAVGGTVLTAELALQHGLACNTAGGTHHAHRDFGSGFCIFNDLAVAARYVRRQGLARRVLIVDLDVHQGDGTAAIFQDDPTVFTFSMHCGRNFPFRKQCSDLDIALPVGMEDGAYLATLGRILPDLLSQVRPDLVFYDAGVDPHREDELGKLSLSDEGLFRRDELVLSTCLSRGYPVACVIGGGYARDIQRLARRHCLLHQAADEIFRRLRL